MTDFLDHRRPCMLRIDDLNCCETSFHLFTFLSRSVPLSEISERPDNSQIKAFEGYWGVGRGWCEVFSLDGTEVKI